MKSTPEHLLYTDGGKFHQQIKKAQENLNSTDFEALNSIEEKVNFLQKNGIDFKPTATQVSLYFRFQFFTIEEKSKLTPEDVGVNENLKSIDAERC